VKSNSIYKNISSHLRVYYIFYINQSINRVQTYLYILYQLSNHKLISQLIESEIFCEHLIAQIPP